MKVADVSAVAATNCRRYSFFRDKFLSDMAFPSQVNQCDQIEPRCCSCYRRSRADPRWRVRRLRRLSLSQSEQNCRHLSRNENAAESRTYVACRGTSRMRQFASDRCSDNGFVKNTALHAINRQGDRKST